MRGLILAFIAAAVLLAPVAAAEGFTVHAGTRGGGMYFEPDEWRVRQGERITFSIVNDDARTDHDWALLSYDGEDIEAFTAGGRTANVTFTASEPGTYDVVCQIVGHKQQGMRGTFIVEEKGLPGPAPLLVLGLLMCVALARQRFSPR